MNGTGDVRSDRHPIPASVAVRPRKPTAPGPRAEKRPVSFAPAPAGRPRASSRPVSRPHTDRITLPHPKPGPQYLLLLSTPSFVVAVPRVLAFRDLWVLALHFNVYSPCTLHYSVARLLEGRVGT